jgi:hypothetical protein
MDKIEGITWPFGILRHFSCDVIVVDRRGALRITAPPTPRSWPLTLYTLLATGGRFSRLSEWRHEIQCSMTHRKAEIIRSLLARHWPHHVALPVEALRGAKKSTPIYTLAKKLAGDPPRYGLMRDGREFMVFCFARPEDAQAFAKRFGGEILDVPAAI